MKKLAYVAYMWHLRGIFVSGRYLAMMNEVVAAVGGILVDLGTNIKSISQFCKIALWLIFAIGSHICVVM